MRFAYVTGARDAKQLWAYLPNRFAVLGGGPIEGGKTAYIIGGLDSAGWTLDDYVIPRLASGLIQAREIGSEQAVWWLYGYQFEYPQWQLDEYLQDREPIAVHKPLTYEGRDALITKATGLEPGETHRIESTLEELRAIERAAGD